MKDKNTRVEVKILDKEYQVACPPDEKQALLQAAAELDGRMRKIRNSGAMIGVDRIAVMVALNLCHELQQSQKPQGTVTSADSEQAIKRLHEKLDSALS